MKSEAARALDLTDRNRFWPSRALAWSLKPKACVSMGAEVIALGSHCGTREQ